MPAPEAPAALRSAGGSPWITRSRTGPDAGRGGIAPSDRGSASRRSALAEPGATASTSTATAPTQATDTARPAGPHTATSPGLARTPQLSTNDVGNFTSPA